MNCKTIAAPAIFSLLIIFNPFSMCAQNRGLDKQLYQGSMFNNTDSLLGIELEGIFSQSDQIPEFLNQKGDSQFKKLSFKKLPLPTFRLKAATPIKFQGGQIMYNGQFRAAIDTPFTETQIFHHHFAANLEFTLAQLLPLRFTYFERRTNSLFFQSYRDVKIEIDFAKFQAIKASRLKELAQSVVEQQKDLTLRPKLDVSLNYSEKLKRFLDSKDMVSQLIRSKLLVLSGQSLDTLDIGLNQDSIVKQAKQFIVFYQNVERINAQVSTYRDSVKKKLVDSEKMAKSLASVDFSNNSANAQLARISRMDTTRMVRKIERFYKWFGSIQKLGIGKVVPNYSDQTLRRMNVTGIDFEYQHGNLFLAFLAGSIDFRAKDFITARNFPAKQNIYAGRIGWGSKHLNHLILTGYKGSRQLLLSRTASHSQSILGLSLQGQLSVFQYYTLRGEITQSSSPGFVGTTGVDEKPSFKLNDRRNKAYAFQLNGFNPIIKSRFELYYQYKGLQFQSFNNYNANAQTDKWYVKFEMPLWKKRLQIRAKLEKNAFENSFYPQRYNGSTTFKNISVSFRNKKWPAFSASFMPSTQVSMVDGLIYENYFQNLNANLNHTYKIGAARANSLLSVNRFFNDASDSGFIYFNAHNIFFSQGFFFTNYSTQINVSRTKNPDYVLTVVDAGISLKISKEGNIGMGIKLNELNGNDMKVGFYARQELTVPQLGALSFSVDKSYLAGQKNQFVSNSFYSLGFTRVFK